MSIENMIVTLHRLPTINLNSSTDWLALSGFLVTALVVVLGTWYNAHVFKGTISGQQSIAEANLQYLKSQSKSEFIAKERLQWIETMRDEVSLFLSLGARVQAASQFVIEPSWVTISSNEADLERNRADYGVKYSEFALSLAQGRMHFAKIELLLDH